MTDFMKLFSDALSDYMSDENKRLSRAWVLDKLTGCWVRGTNYDARLQFAVIGPDMEEYYPEKKGHVRNFIIGYSVEEVHLLGDGGEQGHKYPAEIHEPSGKPFIINQRPMKQEELNKFHLNFIDGLIDFPDTALGVTIIQDLDGYHFRALQSLPQDWEKYNSEKKSRKSNP